MTRLTWELPGPLPPDASGRPQAAAWRRRMGEAVRDGGHNVAAQEHFEAAWAVFESGDAALDGAYAAIGVATVLHEKGDPHSALYVLDRVRAMIRPPDSAPHETLSWDAERRFVALVRQARARTDLVAGHALASVGRAVEAEAVFTGAYAEFVDLGEDLDAARVQLGLGALARGRGQADAALEAYARARHAFAADRRQLEEAMCRYSAALVLADVGRLAAAAEALEEVRPFFVNAGHVRLTADTELVLGGLRRRLGRPAAALRHFEEALETYLAMGLAPEAAEAESLAARCLADLGRQAAAVQRHSAAKARVGGPGREHDAAWADVRWAATELAMGGMARAAELAHAAGSIMAAVGDAEGSAEAAMTLSRVAASMGDDSGAVAWARRAALEMLGAGNASGAARARWCLGVAHLAAGRLRDARRDLEAARHVLARRDEVLAVARVDLDWARALAGLGEAVDAWRIAGRARAVLAAGGVVLVVAPA